MDWQQKFEKDTGISKEAILTGANDMSPIDYHCELANYLIKKLDLIEKALKVDFSNKGSNELNLEILKILGK